MSKTDYQFSKMPADWLKCKELNPTDKYILAFLVLENRADFNKVYKKGFEALGLETGLSRRQCIYIINKLEKLHFIEINNRTRPVEIRVCLERVGGRNQDDGKSATDCTLATQKSATDCTQRVQFTTQKSATDCTHNKYLNNLNINTRGNARENETETADVAAVRSMPDAGQAGENTRQGNQARFDLSDVDAVMTCIENIPEAANFNFLKNGVALCFRPKDTLVMENLKNQIAVYAIADFFKKLHKTIYPVSVNRFFKDEQIIV